MSGLSGFLGNFFSRTPAAAVYNNSSNTGPTPRAPASAVDDWSSSPNAVRFDLGPYASSVAPAAVQQPVAASAVDDRSSLRNAVRFDFERFDVKPYASSVVPAAAAGPGEPPSYDEAYPNGPPEEFRKFALPPSKESLRR